MTYRQDHVENAADRLGRPAAPGPRLQWRALGIAERIALVDKAMRPANDFLDDLSLAL